MCWWSLYLVFYKGFPFQMRERDSRYGVNKTWDGMSEAAETACLKLGNSWNPRKPKSMFLHMQNHSQLANSLFFRIMGWNTFWSSTGAFLFSNTQHLWNMFVCLFDLGPFGCSVCPHGSLVPLKSPVIVCNRIDLRRNLCLVWWFDKFWRN